MCVKPTVFLNKIPCKIKSSPEKAIYRAIGKSSAVDGRKQIDKEAGQRFTFTTECYPCLGGADKTVNHLCVSVVRQSFLQGRQDCVSGLASRANEEHETILVHVGLVEFGELIEHRLEVRILCRIRMKEGMCVGHRSDANTKHHGDEVLIGEDASPPNMPSSSLRTIDMFVSYQTVRSQKLEMNLCTWMFFR